MKRIALAVSCALAAVAFTGCLRAPVIPPPGIIFTDYSAPLDHDFDRTQVGMRTGTAETISILGLVALGDASTRTAASNGGITTVHGADYNYFNVLGVYQKFELVVHGE